MKWRQALLIAIFLFYHTVSVSPQSISVRAAVKSREVYVGESFLFQIQVKESDAPSKPDLSPLSSNFFVEELGGQQNNSESITIINGQMERKVRRGYIFSYRLTPRRAGTLKIPSLSVKVEGAVFPTQSISIKALAPEETEDFKLRMSLSKQKAYVGESIALKITWFIGKNVDEFRFGVPFLQDNPDFDFDNPQVDIDQSKKYFRIPVAGEEVIAQQGQGTLEGRRFTTVSFAKIVIPKRSGTFKLSEARVFCQVLEGYQRRKRGFSDDNFFGFGRQRVYRRYVVPSNTLSLTVLDLPVQGRPPTFTGLVGKYRIVTSAVPTEVKVGDPITLTMRISGPVYLKTVPPPDLNQQEGLATRFKIPKEISSGKLEDDIKVFTQTIRARDETVTEIPPVELNYFNPENGRYEVASGEPIPLTVQRTQVITLADAEGIIGAPANTELETLMEGIAHNYEGLDVLEDQAFSLSTLLHSWSWLGVLFGPLVFYLTGFFTVRRRDRLKADVSGRRRRSAYKKVTRGFKKVKALVNDESRYYEELIKQVRNYLADKFDRPAAGLTFGEVERLLTDNSVDAEAVSKLKRVFEICDAGRFGISGRPVEAREELLHATREVVKHLEKRL